MQNVRIDDIRMLQFRMPSVCPGDADTIGQLLRSGVLFPGVTDSGDRDMVLRNLLALNVVIPSFETFQANMLRLNRRQDPDSTRRGQNTVVQEQSQEECNHLRGFV